MKRHLSILLVGALGASAFAKDANSDFRGFYRRMLPRIEHAFDNKDAAFFTSISTPDFTEVEMGHTMNAHDAMLQMHDMFVMCKTIKCKFRLQSSSAEGNTAVAFTSGSMDSVLAPTKHDKKNHHLHVDMWMKETWVRSGNTWKIQKIEDAKPSNMLLDGKPSDPSVITGGG